MIIDFLIDENVLAEDLEQDIPNVDYTTIVLSYFIMPVRIQINGIDLFEFRNDPWNEAPLMILASNGLLAVKRLKETKAEEFRIIEGPGAIFFKMLDDNLVEVTYDYIPPKKVFIVPYNELLEGFKKFVKKVRNFMWERVPQLNDHPYWGAWMRGNID